MAQSQNGWYASPNLKRRPFVVNGVEFAGGIADNDDLYVVMMYFWTEYAKRVEPLVKGWCWGFNFRTNRNGTDLSNHSSGSALDGNAPDHPNGVPTARTFTAAEINEIHQILSELSFALRWGGDYLGTPDSMHVEVNVTPQRLAVVAQMIRNQQEEDMGYRDWKPEDKVALVSDVVDGIMRYKPKGGNLAVEQLLKQAANAPKVIRQEHQG